MSIQIRLHIDTREPFADGMEFGHTGAYERLSGRIDFAIDPDHPSFQNVVDLQLAPRNSDGNVEYATDWSILKPTDLARGNRRLIYDVVNRGNMRLLQFFNDAVPSNTPKDAEHAGNGFLMRQGYSMVWCGWQGDVAPGDNRMTMALPVACTDQGPVTGLVRAEFIATGPNIHSMPLSGNVITQSYPTANLDTHQATLTLREYAHDERQPLPPTAWQYAKADDQGDATPSTEDCYIAGGLRPGWIYELIYTAESPRILGLGFTAVRDLVSFLRYDTHDHHGTPNPLRQPDSASHDVCRIEHAYAWGRSQSGRFLREFVYRGWNADSQDRKVFSGVWPHVTGAGRLALNYRFGQPDRYPRQHEQHLYPSDQFPFAYSTSTDPWSGKTDAILKRPDHDPLILHTQTASEYWQRRGSLVHTDAFGQDLPPHPQARIFFFASSQHFAAPNHPPKPGNYQQLSNPLNTSPLLRALLVALDQWATDGKAPPDSRIPTRADGTLISATAIQSGFPPIPGVTCPSAPNCLYIQNFGPDFAQGYLTQEPPEEDQTRNYVVLVPSIDADGNDVPGIRTPHVSVPLATFTGWNLRSAGYGENALSGVIGSYVPFAVTQAQRQAQQDPRLSREERYGSTAHYVRRLALAAQQLVDTRLLLDEDADAYIEGALQTPLFS